MKKVSTRNTAEIRKYLSDGYKVLSIGYFVDSNSPEKYLFTLIKH